MHDAHLALSQLAAVFSGLIELRDPSLGRHAKRVALLAERLARQLDLDETEIVKIITAAHLHDIGLVGLPEEIVRKKEKEMTGPEYELVKQHPQVGHSLLETVSGCEEIAQMVLQHHENLDGSGYPNGTTKYSISLGSRILRVADCYDLLEHQEKTPPDEILNHLSAHCGTLYDAKVVSVVFDVVEVEQAEDSEERAFRLEDLEEGMVLARDIKTGRGTFLLSEGCMLTDIQIRRIKNFNRVDPIDDKIMVSTASCRTEHAP